MAINSRRIAKSVKGRRPQAREGLLPGASSGYLGSWVGSLRPSHAGVHVDETIALNLAGIWRGVNVLAGDLSKLPLNVYERQPNGGKRLDLESPLYELLSYPNEYQTGRKLRFTANVHLILWGNAYVEILRDPESGSPLRLELLDPRWVQPRRDREQRLTYWLKGQKSPWSKRKSLLPENVLHFTGLSLNGDVGVSPIQANAEALGTSLALDRYAGSLWGNGAVPNGVIECPPGWPDDARTNFRTMWQDEHGGVGNANKTSILEEGAKWVATSFNPEQLQMLAAREYSVVEIARILGIPPHKLFDLSHDVERTLEESNRDYYETSLEPITQGQADEITLKLMLVPDRKRYLVAFDMSSLMRGNSLERAQRNDILMRNGIITANEWRSEDGRNPFEQDIRIMPLNMGTVADGTTTATPAPADGEPDETPADPEPLPAPPSVDIADEARAVLRESLGRMVRREVLNVRKAGKRGEITPEWIEEYYSDHEAILTEAAGPALSLFAKASGNALEARQAIRSLIDSSKAILTSATTPDTLEALLTRWEVDRVEEIIRVIEGGSQ